MAYTTINKSSDYFNTKLYTGNGGTQSITGVGFQPDFTWIKTRSGTYKHLLVDAVRGVTKHISTVNNAAEIANSDNVTAFASDGFNLASDGNVNANSGTYASWNWRAATGAGSANTDGSINADASVNTTSGFSIVAYGGNGTSGATVGHGLGVIPKMIIVKRRNAVGGWIAYNETLGNTKIMELEEMAGSQTSSAAWNNTSPTSSVFTLGDYTSTNQSGGTYVAYCFAEKQGYSKFGSYIGNGNADGSFIYTGFKPAYVMLKRTDTTAHWFVLDNKRNEFNVVDKLLYVNETYAEGTNDFLDFTSNGFKLRTTNTGFNASGGTYIYMAFAEAPLVGTNNVPATAR
tara:strand:+ start:733 stop:1767 length:1035 start_codon:yes stop_codon:yes gene_type:complete